MPEIPDYLQQVIDDLTIGDDYTRPRTFPMSVATTISRVEVVIKKRFDDLDSSVMPVISVTSIASSSGQITNVGAPGLTLALTFTIPSTSTALLDDTTTYVYGIKAIDSNGNNYTFEEGKLYPNPDIGG